MKSIKTNPKINATFVTIDLNLFIRPLIKKIKNVQGPSIKMASDILSMKK